MNSDPPADTTLPAPKHSAIAQRLLFSWGAHEVEVNEKHPLLTVGRGETSGIVIKSGKVSRLHARVEYRNGHFTLTDKSSNATYVTNSAGKTYKVSNDTYVLMGVGTVSFGIDPETSRSNLFKYAVGS